jgi:hypothetical protein
LNATTVTTARTKHNDEISVDEAGRGGGGEERRRCLGQAESWNRYPHPFPPGFLAVLAIYFRK